MASEEVEETHCGQKVGRWDPCLREETKVPGEGEPGPPAEGCAVCALLALRIHPGKGLFVTHPLPYIP